MTAATPAPSSRPPKTNQSILWKADGQAHTDQSIKDPQGTPKYAAHQFHLQDPLLRALILNDQPSPGVDFKINSWVHGKEEGAVLLTWFVKRAFNLHRLPYHEDRLLSGVRVGKELKQIQQLLCTLTSQRIESITEELRNLHIHTQTCLAAKGILHVQLSRGVDDFTSDIHFNHVDSPQLRGQAGQIVKLKLAAEMLGKSTVQFEMDTLNSWGDDRGYEGLLVLLHRSVAAEDVLYCSTLLAASSSSSESGEWVVINRHPAGLVEFDVGDIEFSVKEIDVKKILSSREDAADFMRRYQPLVYRPSICPQFDTRDRPPLQTTRMYRWRKALAEWLLKQ